MISAFPNSGCPTVYGPVKSRRHGRSLGINLGLPDTKVCTWGCVYCQCGMGERREIQLDERVIDSKSVLDLVQSAVRTPGSLDSVTIAGNSEPTRHPEFLTIVKGLLDLRKELNAKWTLNCLSNGSELDQSDVRRGCDLLDETWIKLDCAIDEMFRRLNRPLPKAASVATHTERLQQVKTLSLQTLVWCCPSKPVLSNWTEANRDALLDLYLELKPKIIHLTTIARNPAVTQLTPVPAIELQKFAMKAKNFGLTVEVYK